VGSASRSASTLTPDQKLLAAWSKEHAKSALLAAKQSKIVAQARGLVAAGQEPSPAMKQKFDAVSAEIDAFVPKTKRKIKALPTGTKDGKLLQQLAVKYLDIVPQQNACMGIYFSVRTLEDVFVKWLKCIEPVNKALVENAKAIAKVSSQIALQRG
jgi:hypothetical protein